MKITVRIPTEQYAYLEVVFDSVEEYEKEYPNFVATAKKVRAEVKKTKENESIPFEG